MYPTALIRWFATLYIGVYMTVGLAWRNHRSIRIAVPAAFSLMLVFYGYVLWPVFTSGTLPPMHP